MIPIALGCALVVLGGAFVFGGGTAARGSVVHTCAAPDRQFLATAGLNMNQLAFWSGQLTSGEAEPGVVSRQAFSESRQLAATGPIDPTLRGVRVLLGGLLEEYGRAIRAKTHGKTGDAHMRRSWRLAGEVHEQLTAAQSDLTSLGCDPGPLLESSG